MPVEHSPQRGARTRSRTRQALEQGQGPPLLGVVNNPVAPTPPPAQQDGSRDPPPSPEPNIRQDLREQEPVVPEPPNEQQLGDPLQNQPDLPLNDPLQNQPDLPLNNPLQNQPDLPLNDPLQNQPDLPLNNPLQNQPDLPLNNPLQNQPDLPLNNPLQNQPDLPLNNPLQNQPDLPLNNPLQNQPDLPLNNMAARFPPAMQSWEAFTQALIATRPPLPEYSGLDYEDPDRYLTKCQEYVTALQLPEGSRLAVLEKGLKGQQLKNGKLEGRGRSTGSPRPNSSKPQLSGIYAGGDSLLKITVIVGENMMSAAVDTAANRNFIHPDWIPKDTKYQPQNITVGLAAQNQTMKVIGTTQITFKVNEHSYTLPVFIAPAVSEPLILGIPWIREEKAIIDADRDVLHFGRIHRQTVPFVQKQTLRLTTKTSPELETGFPQGHKQAVQELISRHAQVLSPHPGNLTRTSTIQHKITLKEPKTFQLPLYRYSDEKRREIERQIKEMLALDIIEPCSSPYSSPIVLAKKRNGTWRFCVDYRKLNSISEDSAQPIPRICDTLKDLGDSRVFSTLDLRSGYWQIPMHRDSKQFTAFSTPSGGTYQFKVMPFGLKGAPGTFQRLMAQEVLSGYMGKFCIGYLDDIIIHSKTYEEHLYHLALVLERLSIHNLTCSPEKVRLGYQSLEYLGFNITGEGNEAKEEYLKEIQKTPTPTTIKQLQSFIGACQWLHEYLPNLAITLAPLTELLKKRTLHWTPEAQKAFEEAKNRFSGPLRLSRPSAGKPFILQTDASQLGMGSVLYQEREDGQRNIIAYASAKFNPTERKYHCNEQECLAIIWAIKRFRHYLEDAPFTLRTDSKTLTWLHKFKDTRGKLLRWSLLLQEFQFKIEHCPGKDNELPDLLSRNPLGTQREDIEDVDRMMPPEAPSSPEPTPPKLMMIRTEEPLVDEIKRLQQEDPNHEGIAKRCLKGTVKHYQLIDDGVWHHDRIRNKWKLSVPNDARERVLHDFHDLAGHPGEQETYRAIGDRFFWPNLSKSVREHVKLCRVCACGKKSNTSTSDIRPHQPKEPWKSIAIDFMGPYPITARRKRFILVVTDLFSRWTEAFPLAASDTSKVIKILEDEIFSRYGYPQSILSDNGPQFRSIQWQQACEKWQTKLHTTAVYSPRANPTERRNQEIKKGLRLDLMDGQHNQWDLILPKVLYNMRCRQNAATGHSPAYVLFGKELHRPGDWRLTPDIGTTDEWKYRVKEVRHAQEKYQQRYAVANEDKIVYNPGDSVYTKAHHLSSAPNHFHAGFASKWDGPFQILAQLSEDIFTINKNGNPTKTHRLEMKPAGTPNPSSMVTNQIHNSPQRSESPAQLNSNHDSTPSLEVPADLSTNLDISQRPDLPATLNSNHNSSSRPENAPATPDEERKEIQDDSEERHHQYNLRRRKRYIRRRENGTRTLSIELSSEPHVRIHQRSSSQSPWSSQAQPPTSVLFRTLDLTLIQSPITATSDISASARRGPSILHRSHWSWSHEVVDFTASIGKTSSAADIRLGQNSSHRQLAPLWPNLQASDNQWLPGHGLVHYHPFLRLHPPIPPHLRRPVKIRLEPQGAPRQQRKRRTPPRSPDIPAKRHFGLAFSPVPEKSPSPPPHPSAKSPDGSQHEVTDPVPVAPPPTFRTKRQRRNWERAVAHRKRKETKTSKDFADSVDGYTTLLWTTMSVIQLYCQTRISSVTECLRDAGATPGVNSTQTCKRIVEDAHRVTAHGGVQLMLSYLQRNFWIANVRRLAVRVYHGCVRCARFRGRTQMQQMDPLPVERVTPQ
ncbi:unnamed protein product [Trichogramma brassicae]|uniref:RNA-directed DNA polymerase n=1 Tax=Trichogramma brassicae TaxID=86971 RepID=A0A6H5IVX2_9HYME|nr:unnamed protein product [Trichogramma brassicae]